MNNPEKEGNFTICGMGIGNYANLIGEIERRGWLWSSLCDKHGVWFISTEDDTPEGALYDLLLIDLVDIGLTVISAGELTFDAEQVIKESNPEIWKILSDEPNYFLPNSLRQL